MALIRLISLSLCLCVSEASFVVSEASFVIAQAPEAIWPGAKYDPAIPTLRQVVGHDHGLEITTPDQVGDYLQALGQGGADARQAFRYARTWEGRPLWVMVIGSPERLAKLDQVKADLQRLADPRTLSGGDADRLVRELPVVTWLSHGVHGNEISSADAALFEAYHLLAAQGDADVATVLRESLVLIDPMQNPDGRARFVFQNLQGRAALPDATPYNAEHDEPWPGGRSNHYLFDMNRDWFAQTQPETRGRITLAREYWPHVTVDLHEQGGDNTYYFAPPADPLNPHITKSQVAAFELFGRANGARFDQRGWPYFIREVYDSFYPGYGESWPIFHGSIGMTYEQASARSLSFARSDETVLTYRDGGHASRQRRARHGHHRREEPRTAVARLSRIPSHGNLRRREEPGSRVHARARPRPDARRPARAESGDAGHRSSSRRGRRSRSGRDRLPAGAYLVSNAQPSGRLIRNLLDPKTDQPEDFIKKQEERRARRLPDQIYDVTAWSLPLLYDVELVDQSVRHLGAIDQCADDLRRATRGRGRSRQGKVGYLMPWGTAAAALTADALRQGLRVHQRGRRLHPQRPAVSDRHGAVSRRGQSVRSARHAHGLGDASTAPRSSPSIRPMSNLARRWAVMTSRFSRAPRVLLAWDTPTSSLSAGWTRYVLERRFGQPVTAVRTDSLARANLADFDVVVLPSGRLWRCDQRSRPQSPEGLAACGRHLDHIGGGDALGDRQHRRSPRYDSAAQGREA